MPELKPTVTFDDFTKLDLRIATVVEADLHPNADRLLKLQVSLGDETRQICAGIKGHYEPGDLVGKQIVVVANLAPRKIRGEESNGMLLAASAVGAEGEKEALALVTPMAEIAAGSSVG